MIKLENVSFSYNQDSQNIIENINIEIKKGEVVAFIGASGCGKTTLTRIFSRVGADVAMHLLNFCTE